MYSGSCRTVADLMRNWRTYAAEDLWLAMFNRCFSG